MLAVLTLLSGPGAASAAGVSVDLDQWAPLAGAWQNGDLNGNNARYPEGGVVPFRLAIEKLSPGNHSVTISYDFTASGHKAYDFLATWNATNHPGLCVPSGGAISSMCPRLPASSSFAFPSDPFTANGLTVRGAQTWSGVSRRLTIYGGTITSISRPVHQGSVDGNSESTMLVKFRSTGSAVLMAWGGHLAIVVLGHQGGRRARRGEDGLGSAVAHAHAQSGRRRRPEPGSEHPAVRDRRRAAARGSFADAAAVVATDASHDGAADRVLG